MTRVGLLALALIVAAPLAAAQPVRLGTLVQVDAAVPDDGPAGFGLPSARARSHATVEGVGLFGQVDFARAPVLLDARLALPLGSGVELTAGRFKTPFSREFLAFRGDLPLADRARVVRALAPGRSVGAALEVPLGPTRLGTGVFEDPAALNGGLLAVGRVEGGVGDALAVGVNAVAGRATPVTLGADVGVRLGAGRAWAEAIGTPRADSLQAVRWGIALTGDLPVTSRHHALARLDVVDDRTPGLDARLDVALATEPRPHVRLFADYGFPTREPGHGDLTLRLQLAVR